MEYTIEPKNKFSLGVDELIQYRELFYFFTWRDIKVKYKQAALGILWAILQPLAMVIIFTMIFSNALKVDTGLVPYPIFALSGLIIWNIFSAGLTSSANSMVNNANIIKKIYFPRLVIPVSSILSVMIDFGITLLFYIGMLIYYQDVVQFQNLIWCLPMSIVLMLITTFGLGTLVASLNVKYRDFQYLLPFFIQFMMFFNPILYNSDSIENPVIKAIMKYNPIANAIQLNRAIFIDSSVDTLNVICSFGVGLFILIIGIYTFRKTEDYFADLA
jgi:lipopolysaccharide transport system permease protein